MPTTVYDNMETYLENEDRRDVMPANRSAKHDHNKVFGRHKVTKVVS